MAVCLHFSTDHALEISMKISMWKFRASVFEFLQLVFAFPFPAHLLLILAQPVT